MDKLTRVLSYAVIFLAGYYMGGGCERKPDVNDQSANRKFSVMERQLRQYENRIDELERKFENSDLTEDYVEKRKYWGKQD